jgi:predicted nuclease of predicted toxin-antitoxin system
MTLRWLLNENFPQPAVLRLRTEGWDVTAIGEDSPSVDDEVVMARACAENRGLATFDRDYGELVFKRGLPAPRLILLLRVPSYQPEEPAEWLLQLASQRQLHDGYFHIFDGDAVRRRPLLARLSGGNS